jgi:hypothetical protein
MKGPDLLCLLKTPIDEKSRVSRIADDVSTSKRNMIGESGAGCRIDTGLKGFPNPYD